MARSIASFNGTVMPPDVDYSHGNIKDAPNGTIADVTSNGDMQQFFQELMFRGGITPNELPDNDTNSYQLVDALANYITSIWGTLSNEPSYVSTFAADPTNPIKYGLISSNQVAFTGKLHDTSPSVSSADTKIGDISGGFRPAHDIIVPVADTNQKTTVYVKITSGGELYVLGTWATFDTDAVMFSFTYNIT